LSGRGQMACSACLS